MGLRITAQLQLQLYRFACRSSDKNHLVVQSPPPLPLKEVIPPVTPSKFSLSAHLPVPSGMLELKHETTTKTGNYFWFLPALVSRFDQESLKVVEKQNTHTH